MFKFKVTFAAFVLVVGLALAVRELFLGHLFTGLALLPATFCCVLAAFVGFHVTSSHTYNFVAGTSLILTIVGVFATHPAYNVQLQVAYLEALDSFLVMDSKCMGSTSELTHIRSVGVQSCGLKGLADQRSGLSELSKGLHFGPGVSLADATYSQMNGATVKSDPCASAYVAAANVCPAAFSDISDKGRKALIAAATSK